MSVAIVKKEQCCGCGACEDICPKYCINLKYNEEGFLCSSVDRTDCIECGLCENVCPELKAIEINEKPQIKKAYVGYAVDEKIRQSGSSGGIFSVFAQSIIEAGGVVYGAAFDELFTVKHIRVDSVFALKKILTSKYVQSDMRGVYSQIQADLYAGKKVMFCGTPCQVTALHHFIEQKKLTDNLVLIDFICHGVPSPRVWDTYKIFLERKLDGYLKYVNFRDKIRAWHDYSFVAATNSGKRMSESHELNAYMQTFISDKNIRKSCFSCVCKPNNYFSDITLGDAWAIEKEKPEWADDKGISFLAVRSQNGDKLLHKLQEKLKLAETSYEQWCAWNPSLYSSTVQNEGRIQFFKDFMKGDFDLLWYKESKIALKKRIRYKCKQISRKLGLESFLRRKI